MFTIQKSLSLFFEAKSHEYSSPNGMSLPVTASFDFLPLPVPSAEPPSMAALPQLPGGGWAVLSWWLSCGLCTCPHSVF